MKNWKVNSWKKYPVKHIPEYPDKKELDQVLDKIRSFPPLVFYLTQLLCMFLIRAKIFKWRFELPFLHAYTLLARDLFPEQRGSIPTVSNYQRTFLSINYLTWL